MWSDRFIPWDVIVFEVHAQGYRQSLLQLISQYCHSNHSCPACLTGCAFVHSGTDVVHHWTTAISSCFGGIIRKARYHVGLFCNCEWLGCHSGNSETALGLPKGVHHHFLCTIAPGQFHMTVTGWTILTSILQSVLPGKNRNITNQCIQYYMYTISKDAQNIKYRNIFMWN